MGVILILLWLGLTFLVAILGANKSIGFWGAFFISLLLSPIIGLIIIVVSSEKRGQRVSSSFIDFDKAKKAEHRGDYEEAIKYYNDVIYNFNNSPVAKEIHLREYRKKQLSEAQAKIIELKNKM